MVCLGGQLQLIHLVERGNQELIDPAFGGICQSIRGELEGDLSQVIFRGIYFDGLVY